MHKSGPILEKENVEENNLIFWRIIKKFILCISELNLAKCEQATSFEFLQTGGPSAALCVWTTNLNASIIISNMPVV